MEKPEKYFEGCGQEGPIRCIFLCEFHHVAGPKITCQIPEDYISKDTFESVSVYIIPKAQLQRSTLTITILGHKILGFPVRIDNKKYARNAFYFNLCFVFDAWARTVQYEPVVKKLSDYLTEMEVESNFLSLQDESETEKKRLCSMLTQVLLDLNRQKMCTLSEGKATTHLKVVKISCDPPPVYDYQVPVFVEPLEKFQSEQWDLTTQQILPFIDGFNHVAKIASEADVENNLVKSCLQNLLYYGVVSLIPIFQYSNMYAATPKIRKLSTERSLQESCVRAAALAGSPFPTVKNILRLLCSMTHGTTVRDICLRYNPSTLNIDICKLVQFAVLQGLIRKIRKYPVSMNNSNLNGLRCMDELCVAATTSSRQLEQQLEGDSSVFFIWK
ncbi:unnamed protein product [Bemisia tabaci]|uniref:Nitrogen permease regulator 2-like protein n=1 Tax=Bemisia tabaci TaxID=7038 RepID=A0A9N9ZZ66_BEMTA|nr:PREDICTED: nitrogen permease regulator 2-like protein [Bemisia tabaci]CAH0382392.1 unnamed protein product [Bemisia tabaci]